VEFTDEKPDADEWVEGGVEYSFGSDEVPF
jgi:hypothetical protein